MRSRFSLFVCSFLVFISVGWIDASESLAANFPATQVTPIGLSQGVRGATYALVDGLLSRSVRGKKKSSKFPLSSGEWQLLIHRQGNNGEGTFAIRLFDVQGATLVQSVLVLAPNETQTLDLATIAPKSLLQALAEINPSGEEQYQAELRLFSGDPQKKKSSLIAVEPFRQGSAATQGAFVSNGGGVNTVLLANISHETTTATISILDGEGGELSQQRVTLLARAQTQFVLDLGEHAFGQVKVESQQGGELLMSVSSRFLRKKTLIAGVERPATVPTTGYATSSFDTRFRVENILHLANFAEHQGTIRLSATDLQGRLLGTSIFELDSKRAREVNVLAIPELGISPESQGEISFESFGSGKILGEIERRSRVPQKNGPSQYFVNATQFLDRKQVTVPSLTPGR